MPYLQLWNLREGSLRALVNMVQWLLCRKGRRLLTPLCGAFMLNLCSKQKLFHSFNTSALTRAAPPGGNIFRWEMKHLKAWLNQGKEGRGRKFFENWKISHRTITFLTIHCCRQVEKPEVGVSSTSLASVGGGGAEVANGGSGQQVTIACYYCLK